MAFVPVFLPIFSSPSVCLHLFPPCCVPLFRRFHIKELHNLYSSPNIITMTKPRRMKRTEHVAHVDGTETDHLHDLGVDVRKIST
jgi:hypothetical protein